jgi:succinylglutamate desuccinylase
MPEHGQEPRGAGFAAARESFAETVQWLSGPEAACLTHAELEEQLDTRGRELLRRLHQDHLDLRAARLLSATGHITQADTVTIGFDKASTLRNIAVELTVIAPAVIAGYRHRAKRAAAAFALEVDKVSALAATDPDQAERLARSITDAPSQASEQILPHLPPGPGDRPGSGINREHLAGPGQAGPAPVTLVP